MRPIDGNKLKEAVEYSRDVKIGYLNHCAEAGHNPDDKDLIEANIKWHGDMLKLIDDASTIEMQRDHLAEVSKKGDLISRQDAIDAIRKDVMGGLNYESIISGLPSAQPEVIPLKWIDEHLEWLGNCDNDFAQIAKISIRSMVELWKVCPECGAERRTDE